MLDESNSSVGHDSDWLNKPEQSSLSRLNLSEFMISRRAVFRSIIVTAFGLVLGPSLGAKMAPEISPRVYLEGGKKQLAQYIRALFKVASVDIDIWHVTHRPILPKSFLIERTAVLGEFSLNSIRDRDLDHFPETSSRNSDTSMIEDIDRETAGIFQDLVEGALIVVATDGVGKILDRIHSNSIYIDNKNFDKIELIKFLISTLPGAAFSSVINFQDISDSFAQATVDEDEKFMNRRKFLKLMAVLGVGLTAGAAGRSSATIISVKDSINRPIRFNHDDSPGYVEDVLSIHEPFNDWLIRIRDMNMVLRTAAFSTLDLSDYIDHIQFSLANGHMGMSEISRKEIQDIEQSIDNDIQSTISHHLRLINRYGDGPQEAIPFIISSLIIDLSLFPPTYVRVNPAVNPELDLASLRDCLKQEAVAHEPFLLMCRAIKSAFEANLTDLQKLSLENAVGLAFDDICQEDTTDSTNLSEIGVAGNIKKSDEVLTILGKEYYFSNGLFAGRK